MASEKESIEKKEEEKGLIEDLVGDLLNLDRGLPATIYWMFRDPGLVISSYFTDRKRFVNPIRFTIFILAVVTTISTFFVDYEQLFQQAMESGSQGNMDQAIEQLESVSDFNWRGYMEKVQEISVLITTKLNQVLYILILAPLMAFFSRMIFRAKEPEFRKHFVMFLYLLATFSLFSILLIPLMVSFGMSSAYVSIAIFTQLVFTIFVQVNYLKLSGFKGYSLAVINFLLGYLAYTVATLIIIYVGALIWVIISG